MKLSLFRDSSFVFTPHSLQVVGRGGGDFKQYNNSVGEEVSQVKQKRVYTRDISSVQLIIKNDDWTRLKA